jgi:hypothetical protein
MKKMGRITEEQKKELKNFIAKKNWEKKIDVSKLLETLNKRDQHSAREFSNMLGENANCPGCYKWWAKKKDVEELLGKITGNKADFKLLKNYFEHDKEDDFYCIYIGKANNIHDRLKHHAKNLYQSTFRRTIYSLKCTEKTSLSEIKKAVDEELKLFKVQFFPLIKEKEYKENHKDGIKTKIIKLVGLKSDCSLLDLEYYFINEHFHILNVDENNYAEDNKLSDCIIGNVVINLKNKKLSKESIKEKLTSKK